MPQTKSVNHVKEHCSMYDIIMVSHTPGNYTFHMLHNQTNHVNNRYWWAWVALQCFTSNHFVKLKVNVRQYMQDAHSYSVLTISNALSSYFSRINYLDMWYSFGEGPHPSFIWSASKRSNGDEGWALCSHTRLEPWVHAQRRHYSELRKIRPIYNETLWISPNT
jgi:hypothetical protein